MMVIVGAALVPELLLPVAEALTALTPEYPCNKKPNSLDVVHEAV